ncbi:hypothetical protein FA95DRAFT_1597107 [Auriscalpium vulgare]|uniref:Uncharacterized protein n=1 Tax=Auriscalpium vulgare TaxID=40419 RepID=A0ACB8RMW0_9AGAM|nr:hypothetical protein FA95DRAFT_1597107 [Auriscalpium vulgare]
MPDSVPRYSRRAIATRESPKFILKPMCKTFPYGNTDCAPWTPAVHPEGALYFFWKAERVYTDCNMYDEVSREEVESFVAWIRRCLEVLKMPFPLNECDLFVDFYLDDDVGGIRWSYYLVDHTARIPFWLHEHDISSEICEMLGVESPSHVRHYLESQYWFHWSFYPAGARPLPRDSYYALMGMLVHGCIDSITSDTSTAPYSIADKRYMVELLRDAKSTLGEESEYLTVSVTRLLAFFAHYKYVYFHGQPTARLDAGHSVYGERPGTKDRTWLIKVLSPLLFYAPEVHLAEIENVWTDEIIVGVAWKKFIEKLVAEWGDIILYATVILTVDVGFLAIPGVVPINGDNSVTSSLPAQITSYLSVLGSVGSIIVGLVLVRHNRAKSDDHPHTASGYMTRNKHPQFGTEPLAIILSLPYALLQWAMLMFLVALLLLCFSSTDLQTRIPVGIFSGATAALMVWCIYHLWMTGDNSLRTWVGSVSPPFAQVAEWVLHRPERGRWASVGDMWTRLSSSTRRVLDNYVNNV